MVTDELRVYVSQQRAAGVPDEALRTSLLQAGWQGIDVAEVLGKPTNLPSSSPSTLAADTSSSSPQQVNLQVVKSSEPNTQPESHPVPDIMAGTVVKSVGLAEVGTNEHTLAAAPSALKRWWLWGAIGLGAVVFVAGGAWAFTYYYLQAPERVLAQAFQNASSVRSLAWKFEANFNITSSPSALAFPLGGTTGASAATFAISGSGSVDSATGQDRKGAGSVQLSYIQGQQKMTVAIEARSIGKVSYVKLTEVPNLGIIDLAPIKDQWLKLDPVELAKDFMLAGEIPDLGETGLTPEQVAQVSAALKETQPIQVVERLAKEDVGAETSYHYRAVLVPGKLKDFLLKVVPIVTKKSITSSEAQELDDAFQKNAAELEQINVELWVGTKDKLVHQVRVSAPAREHEGEKIGEFKVTLTLSDFNKPVQIEAPAEAISLQDFIGSFMGLPPGGMEEARLADADDDGDGLNAGTEVYYGTDSSRADSDGDGYPDGDEIKNGYNPLGAGKLQLITPTSTLNSMDKSRQKSRDAKRVADVKQIQTALELYFMERNTYPLSPTPIVLGRPNTLTLTEGKGFSDTSALLPGITIYMTKVPENPLAGGLPYTYESKDGKTYSLTFALEGNTGGFSAGRQFATPNGIQSENGPASLESFTDFGLSDFNTPSTEATTPDERRVSDIKQLQTALELYYADNNTYPKVAKPIVLGQPGTQRLTRTNSFTGILSGNDTYLNVVPQNPLPGGAPYTYSSNASGSTYVLSFKLESETQGLKAGYQCATPFGINWNVNSACVLK